MASPIICVRRAVRALLPNGRVGIKAGQYCPLEHAIGMARRVEILQSDVPTRGFANATGVSPEYPRMPASATKTTAKAAPVLAVMMSSRHAGILQRSGPLADPAGPFRLLER